MLPWKPLQYMKKEELKRKFTVDQKFPSPSLTENFQKSPAPLQPERVEKMKVFFRKYYLKIFLQEMYSNSW